MADSKNHATNKLREALAEFANTVLKEDVSEEIRLVFFGASFTALGKKDGGIRPVAAGLTLRMLVAKIVRKRVQNAMGHLLRPVQLGFGRRSGCEGIVHLVRNYFEDSNEQQKVLMKLDFRNAFNMVFRSKILDCALEYIPKYACLTFQCYRYPTNLLFGKFVITWDRGVQQGDPL